MRYCLQLLKPDGMLLIQAPQFKEGMSYNALVESHSPFLDQLRSEEHLYLFSERSVKDFFRRLGAEYICFEQAIFAHYDMFFTVSRIPLQVNTSEQIESALLQSPCGRIVLALLDLDANTIAKSHNAISQIQTLTGWVKEAQAVAEGLQNSFAELTVAHAKEMATLKSAMDEQTVAHAKEMGALQDILSLPIMRFARRISDIQNRIAKKFTGGGGV
jgi:hypothetical protein